MASATTITAAGRGETLPALPSARPPLAVRLLARLRKHGLDDRIAAGSDVVSSRLLAARAEVLIAPATRLELARDLETILALAERPAPRRIGAIPLRTHEVRAAGGALRALIEELRGPDPMTPRAIALARRLIHDGRTPVYVRGPRGAVTRAVRDALDRAPAAFA